MEPIKLEFINKDVQLRHPILKHKDGSDYFVSVGFRIGNVKSDETEEDAKERVIKRIHDSTYLVSNAFKQLSDTELRNCLVIIEFDKPKSYPKFSNEKKFSAFDGKYINPEILNIRWHAPTQTWEYRLRNIGHVFDYHEEMYLKEIL